MNVRKLALRTLALAVAIALAACSGGSGTTGGALPATHGLNTGAASLRIIVPAAVAASSTARRSQYVSPATQSVKVAALPTAGCSTCTSGGQTVTANLNASSPNCVTQSGSLVCQIAFALQPGTYMAGVTTYAGTLNASQQPTGAILSENQAIPITVASNQNTVVTAILNGLPKSMDLTVSVPYVRPGARFQLITPSTPVQIVAIARDAAGDQIVGPGAPAFTITLGNGGTWQAVITGGTINATVPAHNSPLDVKVTAQSPECAVAGAICVGNLSLDLDDIMAIASPANNSVVMWQLNTAQAYATITNGVTNPTALTFDLQGNLFIASSNNRVTEYAPPYNGAPIATITSGLSGPTALMLDNAGTLYVANAGGSNDVTIYPQPYTTTTPGVISAGMHGPGTLRLDEGTNDIFVAQRNSNSITAYASPYAGQSPAVTITNGVVAPADLLLLGVSGILYSANGNGTITEYQKPYSGAPTATIVSTPAAPVSGPAQLVTTGTYLVEADPFAHVVNYYPIGSTTASLSRSVSINPGCVASDGDGVVYVCDVAFTQILAFTPPYTGTPYDSFQGSLQGAGPIAIYP
jgi:hypothetical protein